MLIILNEDLVSFLIMIFVLLGQEIFEPNLNSL